MEMGLAITLLSLLVWVGLLTLWGQFWRSDQRLNETEVGAGEDGGDRAFSPSFYPAVCAVVPARNEAELLPVTLRSLLQQDYPGEFRVILVDDQSSDGTAEIAVQVASELNCSSRLDVIQTGALPPGWTGKLWAMEQGVRHVQAAAAPPDYLLLTDADIAHDRANLRQLITKAQQEELDLVSLMVLLRCQSLWEKLLIPAFVFFFQKLYPFRWVNDPTNRFPMNQFAAAAGGCILMRREVLLQIGGLQVVRQALIDDCALAQAVKRSNPEAVQDPTASGKITSGKIWLGLTQTNRSLRSYDSLRSIWEMVSRTAFTQLRYSPALLLLALVGMILIYVVPPLSTIVGTLTGNWAIAASGCAAWLLMTLSYLPTVRLYGGSIGVAFCLPGVALLYTVMTVDSAWQHWRGQGGAWKGRVYLRDS